ncbi:SGS-domain-containing protein [Coniochaeta ligniaria NRRL 30616]|uniref:SGS-domain-containing protein n=1 Tax=Coniochaeta ligniaria NRRL 30616 TaxID=1408157 RepID=A0A1J7J4R1_9PEZI|nr:SGS-domain-containing protein [Coniochaeta ligniaria NRRL 30616]
MSTHGQKGIDALKARNYAEALVHLDRALETSQSPTWLLARSQANQQLQRYSEALRDAELAYHTAAERGSGNSRKQMIDAQYRRAVVLLKLGRYADADCCAKWSQLLCEGRPAREDDGVEKQVDDQGYYTVTLEQAKADTAGQPKQGNPGDGAVAQALSSSTATSQDWNRAYIWRCQALGKMEDLPRDDPGRKVTVTKVPQRPTVEKKVDTITKSAGAAAQPPVASSDKERSEAPPKPTPEPGSVPDDKLKARADFYQTGQSVTISFFVKGVDKEALKPRFHDNYVVLYPLPREAAPYVKPGDRESYSTLHLGGQIVPASSRCTVSPRKIELVLQKAEPGVKWATWGTEVIGQPTEDAEGQASAAAVSPNTARADTSVKPDKISVASPSNAPKATADSQPAPAYPTSSKTGPKNWDKVADGEVADDEDNKDVNFFFKQLYKNATPEQQRAMMKSFTESNGTALSTDWNDVSKRTVDTVPPEGVEAKKWD